MAVQSPFGSGRDYLGERGAAALARMVEAYWAAQGYPEVQAYALRVSAGGRQTHGPVFVVRSNLDERGLPPGATLKDLLKRQRRR